MNQSTRREFLATTVGAGLGWGLQEKGDRPPACDGVRVVNPRSRVPVSLLIDDSTCLVNLAHFCIPQFAHAWPDRYKQDWRKLPREIPDAFVRTFGEWCRENGVKGKYSVIPFPACVGWIDREMPGWTRRELDESLKLLRDFMSQDWDFTPEMVTHTRMIDTKSGKAHAEYNQDHMENSWSAGKSVDQLTDYCAYALRANREAGIECQGVTSPGGFGGRSLPEYSQAVLAACRDVFKTEIPFYLKKIYTDDKNPEPEVLYASGLDGPDPKCVVSVIGCTGDWFGGWDGLEGGTPEQCITEDGKGGRLPQVIGKGQPAVLVSHWPGMYFNGEEHGFKVLKTVVKRLHATYDNLLWMKFSELSRYWAAKECTRIERVGGTVTLKAPFAAPAFTVEISAPPGASPKLTVKDQAAVLGEVARLLELKPGTWVHTEKGIVACFDLPKGVSRFEVA
jgi:hypothetical protein